jgi:site-specific DNA recombinase
MDDQQIDFTKLKYVLYARKSTTDETRQVRSIEDQITDCKEYAKRNGLKIAGILREAKSAKFPHKRSVFNQMIKDLKNGKYDGVLSWHIDRLARNMLEAGMVINMVDQHIIKDLKFVTQTFTNDSTGKMMLGISFVMSKQYSDDLSQKVTRGVRRSLQEGKSPIPKHGYIRDENGLYQPDGNNFQLIQNAWQMRLQGHSLEEIAESMNKNGYGRSIKKQEEQ